MLVLAQTAESRVAEVGDYVVVFSEIAGCPDFPGIIAAPRIDEDGAFRLPHLSPVRVEGNTEIEVSKQVSRAIATKRSSRKALPSLRVDVLTEDEFADIRELYFVSLRYLVSGRCDRPATNNWRLWRDQWNKEWQHMEHLERLERDRTAALPPNKSGQRTAYRRPCLKRYESCSEHT